MTEVTIVSFLPCGLSLSSSSVGGSVARARAAKVSMIKFTQSIYTDVKGESPSTTPPMKAINIATTFTVN